MDAKAYLMYYKRIRFMVSVLKEFLDEFMRYPDLLAEVCKSMSDRIREQELAAEEIVQTIESLPNPKHVEILRLRYIEGMKWLAIQQKTFYSERACHDLHQKALKQIEMRLEGK